MKTASYAVFCLPNGSCVLAALSTKLRGCTEGADARGDLGESLHEPSPERADARGDLGKAFETRSPCPAQSRHDSLPVTYFLPTSVTLLRLLVLRLDAQQNAPLSGAAKLALATE